MKRLALTRTKVSVAVAVAVVLALVAAGGIFLRGGVETYEVTAYFPRAIGLFERSTVRVLGVEVGRIEEVAPEGDRIRVAMNIEEGVRIPKDASAIIVPISLISDRYIQLSPVWRGGAFLGDGDDIPLERGMVPAELDDLLGTLKKFLEALEPGTPDAPGALGRFVQNAERALANRGPELGTAVDALTTILTTLGRNAGSVDAAISDLDSLLAELALHDDALRATNRGLGTVFSSLANEQAALQSGTGNLASLVQELGTLVREHRGDLTDDLLTLAQVSDVLYRRRQQVLDNIMWLPVLSKGAHNAHDPVGKRMRVRDFPLIAVKP